PVPDGLAATWWHALVGPSTSGAALPRGGAQQAARPGLALGPILRDLDCQYATPSLAAVAHPDRAAVDKLARHRGRAVSDARVLVSASVPHRHLDRRRLPHGAAGRHGQHLQHVLSRDAELVPGVCRLADRPSKSRIQFVLAGAALGTRLVGP